MSSSARSCSPIRSPGALDRARFGGAVLFSRETLLELADVLWRPKFEPYLQPGQREEYLDLITAVAEVVPISVRVSACRDPRDNKFLEVAVNGNADAIISGDADLLTLHPFQRISILSPADFVG